MQKAKTDSKRITLTENEYDDLDWALDNLIIDKDKSSVVSWKKGERERLLKLQYKIRERGSQPETNNLIEWELRK